MHPNTWGMRHSPCCSLPVRGRRWEAAPGSFPRGSGTGKWHFPSLGDCCGQEARQSPSGPEADVASIKPTLSCAHKNQAWSEALACPFHLSEHREPLGSLLKLMVSSLVGLRQGPRLCFNGHLGDRRASGPQISFWGHLGQSWTRLVL